MQYIGLHFTVGNPAKKVLLCCCILLNTECTYRRNAEFDQVTVVSKCLCLMIGHKYNIFGPLSPCETQGKGSLAMLDHVEHIVCIQEEHWVRSGYSREWMPLSHDRTQIQYIWTPFTVGNPGKRFPCHAGSRWTHSVHTGGMLSLIRLQSWANASVSW